MIYLRLYIPDPHHSCRSFEVQYRLKIGENHRIVFPVDDMHQLYLFEKPTFARGLQLRALLLNQLWFLYAFFFVVSQFPLVVSSHDETTTDTTSNRSLRTVVRPQVKWNQRSDVLLISWQDVKGCETVEPTITRSKLTYKCESDHPRHKDSSHQITLKFLRKVQPAHAETQVTRSGGFVHVKIRKHVKEPCWKWLLKSRGGTPKPMVNLRREFDDLAHEDCQLLKELWREAYFREKYFSFSGDTIIFSTMTTPVGGLYHLQYPENPLKNHLPSHRYLTPVKAPGEVERSGYDEEDPDKVTTMSRAREMEFAKWEKALEGLRNKALPYGDVGTWTI